MPSAFVDEWADAQIDVYGEFGEPFLITPATVLAERGEDVNAPAQRDAQRITYPVTLIVHEKGTDYFPSARGVSTNAAQKMVGAELMLVAFDRNLLWQPRAGDRAQRLKNGVSYRVVRVEPDDVGWIWLPVTVER